MFPFSSFPPSSSDNFQLAHTGFVTYRKKLEECEFVNKEFLHKKINNKDVYVDYDAVEDIPEGACRWLRQYGGFYSTELK